MPTTSAFAAKRALVRGLSCAFTLATTGKPPSRTRPARCALPTAYFSRQALPGPDYHHVTTSTGRPDQPLHRLALGLTTAALNLLARLLPGLTMHFRRYLHKKRRNSRSFL